MIIVVTFESSIAPNAFLKPASTDAFTVSYTHLDVYKRQASNESPPIIK